MTAVIQEASDCSTCGGTMFTRHGVDRKGQQRWKCNQCGRTSIGFASGIPKGIRVPRSTLVNFMVLVGQGHTLRTATKLSSINKDTGTSILHRLGYVRKCRTCSKPIGGNRFLFCRDECQQWTMAKPKSIRVRVAPKRTARKEVFSGAANVMQYLESHECGSHVNLAMEIAKEYSEDNFDSYLGPIYEGIESAHQRGIVDQRELRRLAKEAVKEHWREIQDFGRSSLDAMREANGYEFATYDAEPEW